MTHESTKKFPDTTTMDRRAFLKDALARGAAAVVSGSALAATLQSCDPVQQDWTQLKNPKPLPSGLSLKDQDGNAVDLYHGTFFLNTMIAYCPTVCPMNLFPQMNAMLSKPGNENVRAITVTVWPDKDRDALKFAQQRATGGMTDAQKKNWSFCATATQDETNELVKTLAQGWGDVIVPPGDASNVPASNDKAHPTSHYLVKDGIIIGLTNGLSTTADAQEKNERTVKALQFGLDKNTQQGLER